MAVPEAEKTLIRSGKSQDAIICDGKDVNIQRTVNNLDRKPGTPQPMSSSRPKTNNSTREPGIG